MILRLPLLLVVLTLSACNTRDPNQLMALPGPWVTEIGPGHYEVVVRKQLGVRSAVFAYNDELRHQALRVAAETAKKHGADRFAVLSDKVEIIKYRSRFSTGSMFPLVRMEVLLLKKDTQPPDGKPIYVTEGLARKP